MKTPAENTGRTPQPGRELFTSGGRWRPGPAMLTSIAATLFTVVASSGLAPVSHDMHNVLLLPVALSAYLGGLGAGLIAVFLSVVGTGYFLLQRVQTFVDAQPRDAGELIIVAVTGTVITLMIHLLQEAQRKAAAVPRLEDQLTKVAASVPGVIYALRQRPDGSMYFPYASPRVRELFGLGFADVDESADAAFAAIHPDDLLAVRVSIDESVRTLTPWHRVFRIRHPVRGEVWMEGQSVPQREADGSTLWHGYVSDVTERVRAEEALRERERRYQTLFDLSPAGILLEDAHGKVVDANAAICSMLGKKREELVGSNVRTFVPPEEQDRVERHIAAILGGNTLHHEVENVGADGSRRFIELRETAVPLPDGRPGILAIVDDVTDRRNADAALRASERQYREKEATLRALLDSIPDFVFIKDQSFVFRGCNKALEDFGRIREEDLVGKTDYDLHTREEADLYRAQDREILAGSPLQQYEGWLLDGRGERRLLHTLKTPLRDADGRIVGLIGVSRDITERDRAQKALDASREQYRFLFESMKEGFAFCQLMEDERGRIDYLHLDVNPSFERLTGLKNARGRRISELVPGLHVSNPRLLEVYRRVAKSGRPEVFEDYVEPLKQWYSISAYSPSPGHFVAMFDVITDRKRAEQALRQGEERFRSTLDTMLEGCQIIGFDRRYLYVNECAARYGRKTREELLGRRMTEVYPGIEKTELYDQIVRCLESRQALQTRCEFSFPDGEVRWFDLSMQPVPEGMSILSIDITERRQTEDLLRQNEERFRQLFERVTKLAVQGYGPDGTVRLWNKASEDLYGYSAAEAIGRNLVDLIIPPEAKEYVRSAVRQMVETGAGNHAEEIMLMRKDGSLVPVFSNHAVIDVHGRGKELYCIDIDLSDLKQAEAAARLRHAALEAAANAIVITDRDGVVEWVNPAFSSLSGYTAAECLGRRLGDLTRSGRHDPAFYERLWSTILAGRVWQGEIVDRRKDGSLFTAELTITPVRDDSGAIARFIGIKQDITQRKQLELQALRNQRLDSVGRLAAGIAHDLNNILMPMVLGPTVIRPALHDPAALSVVDTIEASARRGAALVQQLQLFGRGVEVPRAPMRPETAAQAVMDLVVETFPKNIAASLQVPPGLPPIVGDATQIHQMLLNLCVNARDAMPGGGCLQLELSVADVDAALAAANPGASPGRYVVFTIRDNGTGIPPDVLDRIYDPFFTTKDPSSGAGLGLSIALGIVRSHRGFIQVESAPGSGSAFSVLLPASHESVAPAAPPPPPPPVTQDRGQGRTVLVVDDEDHVRNVARRMLEFGGFEVLEATNGVSALEVLATHGDRVSLVLTDLLMPVMDGAALMREICRTRPHLPLVAMSGNRDGAEFGRVVREHARAFLAKPFTGQELFDALDTAAPP